jgi:hypothetical protein
MISICIVCWYHIFALMKYVPQNIPTKPAISPEIAHHVTMLRRHRVAQDAAGRGPCRRTPARDTMSDGPCTTGGERGKGVTLTLGTSYSSP